MKSWLAPGLLIIGISTAINFMVVNHLINNQVMTALDEEVAYLEQRMPQVATINTNHLVARFQEEDVDPMKAMGALSLLTEMLRRDGVILLDEQLVMTGPSKFSLNDIDIEQVYQAAEAQGIDVDEKMKANIQRAEEDARKMLEELESLMQ